MNLFCLKWFGNDFWNSFSSNLPNSFFINSILIYTYTAIRSFHTHPNSPPLPEPGPLSNSPPKTDITKFLEKSLKNEYQLTCKPAPPAQHTHTTLISFHLPSKCKLTTVVLLPCSLWEFYLFEQRFSLLYVCYVGYISSWGGGWTGCDGEKDLDEEDGDDSSGSDGDE